MCDKKFHVLLCRLAPDPGEATELDDWSYMDERCAAGEDGCQELIEDTANMQKAWIEKMMSRGLCSCDEEHMFDCRASDRADDVSDRADDVDVKASDVEQQAFDDVLDRILGEKVSLFSFVVQLVYTALKDCNVQTPRFNRHLSAASGLAVGTGYSQLWDDFREFGEAFSLLYIELNCVSDMFCFVGEFP